MHHTHLLSVGLPALRRGFSRQPDGHPGVLRQHGLALDVDHLRFKVLGCYKVDDSSFGYRFSVAHQMLAACVNLVALENEKGQLN